jgi:hypothetical protein
MGVVLQFFGFLDRPFPYLSVCGLGRNRRFLSAINLPINEAGHPQKSFLAKSGNFG